ncbi:hypothetical protein ANANG_G00307840, partial [Anguilla anguilla]
NTWNGEKTWEAILSFVISKLSKGRSVYEADTEEMSVLSSSVWSQQSIEYNLQQFCLPFLRLCSLLQHHLYGDDLPGCPREKEFSVLASGLGLLSSTLEPSSKWNSAHCLEWVVCPFELTSLWCAEVTGLTEMQAEQTLALLVQDPHWAGPHLLQLPENYNAIFQYYHRKSCTACSKVPKDPAVCLVCGTFVCLKGLCCKQHSYCECV